MGPKLVEFKKPEFTGTQLTLIEYLEAALKDAKAGDYKGGALTFIMRDGQLHRYLSVLAEDHFAIAGMLEFQKLRVLDEIKVLEVDLEDSPA